MVRVGRWPATLLALGMLLAVACGDDGGGSAGGRAELPAPVGRDVEPRPSAGCGSSTVDRGRSQVTLRSGGTERWFLRRVPPAHDGEVPVPVVLDMHGYGEGAQVHARATRLGALGASEGFVTLTPHGQGEVPRWEPVPGSVDATFLHDLLDLVEAELCVDTARIYATGLSNGAMMTSALACGMSDRIAAAAPVAGVALVPACDPDRPVPVVAFHGTDDTFLRYEGGFGPGVSNLPAPDGGEGSLGDGVGEDAATAGPGDEAQDDMRRALTPVPDVMEAWAERNGCVGGSEEARVSGDVVRLAWECPVGADVQLYRVDGGGHTWPGSGFLAGIEEIVGRTTMSVSANEVMWEFFQEQALRA